MWFPYLPSQVLRMEQYTFEEQADMHMTYGAARGNGRAAQRLYAAQFPFRRHPHYSTFAAIHRRLRDSGRFRPTRSDVGRPRHTRTARNEEEVLEAVATNPRTNTRAVAYEVGISQASVWRTVHEQLLHPYHIQRVQALTPADFQRRREFSQWYINQTSDDGAFSSLVLFTDETTFTRTGMFNTHNMHYWDEENPHITCERAHQQRFSVNVWCGILGDNLLGPYVLHGRLTGETYLHFLENILPCLLEDVPLTTRRAIWFMHDGAPAHNSHIVQDHLNRTFHGRLIANRGPISWPPRSPDLNPLDFYLWGQLKTIVYATPVDRQEDLLPRIQAGCDHIRNLMPRVLGRVRNSMIRRCNLCIEVGGNHIEHLL